MNWTPKQKLAIGLPVFCTALLAIASRLLPKGLALASISDIVSGLLLLCALVAFAVNGVKSKGRLRWFWLLQAAGWTLWLSDQIVWITFDLILQKKVPAMYPADALLFLAGAPMFAGLLLRPHREPSERSARLGALDFLLLLLWWLYLYVSFVVCWQYISPNEYFYNRNFDVLAAAESLLLAGVLLGFFRKTERRWKSFYAIFCAAIVFNGIAFWVINNAIERDVYFTGSWYDIPYCLSFSFFTFVAVTGQGLAAETETAADGPYNSWISNVGMTAVLSLPIIAFYALLDPHIPHQAAVFRVMVTLATMFLMAFLLFLQHHRLNQELMRTNVVLEEASLTDPLTGLRNRRFFSATIEADVSQTLRSHADAHDPHTRDLVFYLIDADNFKDINDRFGHDVGDKLLLEMARRLSSSIRHSDVLVRWGGEEFLIVSRYTDRAEAELLARRVLSAVADTPFSLGPSGQTLYRTCSMGWAAFPWFLDDTRAVSYAEVLTLADRALNQAKKLGKNRAIGMLPASGRATATTLEGLHNTALKVEVLAIDGPGMHA